ncbi:hypothetical protein PGTUg99_033564 [Puccinia graminis f. sp. tritici]|uniref:Uncharacterized protein n=1 Tax=Puccinia graminis f. sp. tritici TaxID=56615 RepID=A0A5B0S738_PUCGR|nr:hypothetical protein PGTUg99_033564 [Puccinia graminis f. sp. tritici]
MYVRVLIHAFKGPVTIAFGNGASAGSELPESDGRFPGVPIFRSRFDRYLRAAYIPNSGLGTVIAGLSIQSLSAVTGWTCHALVELNSAWAEWGTRPRSASGICHRVYRSLAFFATPSDAIAMCVNKMAGGENGAYACSSQWITPEIVDLSEIE